MAKAVFCASRVQSSAVHCVDLGKVLLIGGLYMGRTDLCICESFDDCRTWSVACECPPFGERRLACAEYVGGSVVLFGGASGAGFDAVWRSSDGGRSWAIVSRFPHLRGPLFGMSTCVHESVVYAMGGISGSSYSNTVFRSVDCGASWSVVRAEAPWPPRMGARVVALGGDEATLLLCGGHSKSAALNDVWRSTDGGSSWRVVIPRAPWAPRCFHAMFVSDKREIIVLGGNSRLERSDGAPDPSANVEARADAWASSDGASWTRGGADLSYALGFLTTVRSSRMHIVNSNSSHGPVAFPMYIRCFNDTLQKFKDKKPVDNRVKS